MINSSVLVLNKNYQPLTIISLKRALSLLVVGVAKAVDENYRQFDFQSWVELSVANNEDYVGLVNRIIKVPKVVLLCYCDRQPKKHVKFSRHNIYLRDKNICQYCGNQFQRSELNLDHVVPRSLGGKSSWNNVVCSCYSCNLKKGGRTPEQARMRLLKEPCQPNWNLLYGFERYPMKEWMPFLNVVDASYWHLELDKN